MRILAIQFVPSVRQRAAPRFEPNLGTLLSLLKERQHEVSLLGLSRFDVEAIKAALARGLPQLIYADISAVCGDIARRALQYIAEKQFLPVVAGGTYATVDPAACLSLPAVQAVAIGEPDASLATYFERIKDPAVGQVVQGVWLRDERGLARPQLPPLVEDLDSLPLPERELFRYADHVRATGEIEIAIGRGCPQRCKYCLNAPIGALYAGRGQWVRRRSPEHVLDEIELLRGRYEGARRVRFLDHSFALEAEWLAALLGEYARRGALPFRCHLRANSADDATVKRLADAGCRAADIEVISGSDFVRNEIFDMDLAEEQIAATFERCRAAGVQTRAIVYLGAPYETEASLDETFALLRRIRADAVDARPYFPWPGTAAEATCRVNGWLHSRGQEQYHADRAGIHMGACPPAVVEAALRRMRQEFAAAEGEPWWRRWSNALGGVFGRNAR